MADRRFGAFTFHVDRRQLLRDGANVHLTPKAFDLLALLIERTGIRRAPVERAAAATAAPLAIAFNRLLPTEAPSRRNRRRSGSTTR